MTQLTENNVFLVGGAVRDMALGLSPKDRDYVVTGVTPADMFAIGFSQVGADFPVFLHPETGDEYALARRESKTGKGYLGFVSEFGPGCLDSELLQAFVDLGYDPDGEYEMEELMEVFRRIAR
jgi:tRNA nucleotidyltransferase (CCA-adding enzyme)